MVDGSWSAIEDTFRSALLRESGQSDAMLLLVVGTGIAAKNEAEGSLEPVALPNLGRWLQGAGDERLVTIVDAVRMARGLKRALIGTAGERGNRMATALDAWASSRPILGEAEAGREQSEEPFTV